jgi:hypothetical protein
MVQLKHNITGKVHNMNEKQYNKMVSLGQTFPNYTRVVDTKKLVTELEDELKEKLNGDYETPEDIINKTDEPLINTKKKKKDDL